MRTTPDIHNEITLGLRTLGTNVFGVLDEYALDIHLNHVADSILRDYASALLDETFMLDPTSQAATRERMELMSRFNNFETIDHVEFDGSRFYITIPNYYDHNLTTHLYNNVRYSIYTNGTTQLASFGFKNAYAVNEEFVCRIPDKALNQLVVGDIYRIKSIGKYAAYASNGAPSNYRVGTIFTCTSAVVTAGSYNVNDVLEVIAQAIPTGGTNSILKPVSTLTYKSYISTQTYLPYKHPITNGILPKHRYFLGESQTVPPVDIIYNFTSDFTIVAGTTYQELKAYPAVLKTIEAAVRNIGKYAGNVTGPIVSIEGDRIYFTSKIYEIHRVVLYYVRERVPFNYYLPHIVDFDQNMIPFLIDKTIKYISAVNNNPNYSQVNNEMK